MLQLSIQCLQRRNKYNTVFQYFLQPCILSTHPGTRVAKSCPRKTSSWEEPTFLNILAKSTDTKRSTINHQTEPSSPLANPLRMFHLFLPSTCCSPQAVSPSTFSPDDTSTYIFLDELKNRVSLIYASESGPIRRNTLPLSKKLDAKPTRSTRQRRHYFTVVSSRPESFIVASR